MTFGDYPAMFVPTIQGEFTSLLCQDHGGTTTMPPVRRLDFNEKASTSRFEE